ncbi:MAG TPA: four helix bundle protein [Terracidiphilus sp.]
MRRASFSVASHIAEGYGKNSKGQYLQSLGHAGGSNSEVQTQLFISGRLRYGNPESYGKIDDLSQQVSRMLVSPMSKLEHATN